MVSPLAPVAAPVMPIISSDRAMASFMHQVSLLLVAILLLPHNTRLILLPCLPVTCLLTAHADSHHDVDPLDAKQPRLLWHPGPTSAATAVALCSCCHSHSQYRQLWDRGKARAVIMSIACMPIESFNSNVGFSICSSRAVSMPLSCADKSEATLSPSSYSNHKAYQIFYYLHPSLFLPTVPNIQ